jgi:hypothetical protein
MDITIKNIELDENYRDLIGIVPFRSVPVRGTTVRGWKLRSQNPEIHRLWAWVSYKEVEPFKISPDKESYSSIIDVNLYGVDNFKLDYNEMVVRFVDGNTISFDLPIERYSNIVVHACY